MRRLTITGIVLLLGSTIACSVEEVDSEIVQEPAEMEMLAQSAPPSFMTSECDFLGSAKEDRRRMAPAVSDDDFVPQLVVQLCQDAIRESPDKGRYYFMVGRGYYAIQDYQSAFQALSQAAEKVMSLAKYT